MATQALSSASSRAVPRPRLAEGMGVQLRIRTARDIHDRAFVQSWDALAAAASEPNPFYESWYLGASLEHLDDQSEVQLLCVERDGVLFGLLPLIRQRSYYGHPLPHWRNWVHANCFCGLPLIAAGAELWVWQAILDWCDSQGGLALFLHLTHIPDGCVPTDILAELCSDNNRDAFCVKTEQRALLQSRLSAEDYLASSMTKKRRKEMNRQARRLSELGELQFSRQSGAEGLDKWIAEFLELEAAGWKGEAQSALAADEATAAIFESALEGAAQRGKLERLSLTLDAKPIAMLANFMSAPGAFSFKTAFDETCSRYSPGVLLQRENLDLLERDGIDWCDSCAGEGHPMIDRIWKERRTIQRINIALGGKPRRALFRQIARQEGGTPLVIR